MPAYPASRRAAPRARGRCTARTTAGVRAAAAAEARRSVRRRRRRGARPGARWHRGGRWRRFRPRGKAPTAPPCEPRRGTARRNIPSRGAANEDAVYCIRAVGFAYPQSQVTALRTSRRESRRARRRMRTATSAATAPEINATLPSDEQVGPSSEAASGRSRTARSAAGAATSRTAIRAQEPDARAQSGETDHRRQHRSALLGGVRRLGRAWLAEEHDAEGLGETRGGQPADRERAIRATMATGKEVGRSRGEEGSQSPPTAPGTRSRNRSGAAARGWPRLPRGTRPR